MVILYMSWQPIGYYVFLDFGNEMKWKSRQFVSVLRWKLLRQFNFQIYETCLREVWIQNVLSPGWEPGFTGLWTSGFGMDCAKWFGKAKIGQLGAVYIKPINRDSLGERLVSTSVSLISPDRHLPSKCSMETSVWPIILNSNEFSHNAASMSGHDGFSRHLWCDFSVICGRHKTCTPIAPCTDRHLSSTVVITHKGPITVMAFTSYLVMISEKEFWTIYPSNILNHFY